MKRMQIHTPIHTPYRKTALAEILQVLILLGKFRCALAKIAIEQLITRELSIFAPEQLIIIQLLVKLH